MKTAKLIKTALISGITLAILNSCGGGGGNPLSWLLDKEWQGVERVDNVDSHGTYFGPFNKNYLAVNSNGNIVLTWSQLDSSNHSKIWVSKYDGDSWSTPDSDIKPNNNASMSPSVSITDNNKILVAWEQFTGSHYVPKANIYDGNWGGIIANINYGSDAINKSIALATKDDITVVVWSQKFGSHKIIIARVYNHNTGTWGPNHPLSNSSYDSEEPQVTIDSNNRAVIVWKQKNSSGKFDLRARIYTASTLAPIGSVQSIDQLSENVYKPSIASDNSGNTLVVWKQLDGSLHTNIYASKLSGTTWSYLGEIDNSNKPAYDATIKYNKASNEFVAIWSQMNSDNKFVIHTNTYSSGSWQGVEVLEDAADATLSKEPKIAFDSDGNAVAIWRKRNSSGKYDVVAKSYDGSDWGDAEVIDNLDEDAIKADIVFDGDDDAVVVWKQKDSSGKYHIFTNTLE